MGRIPSELVGFLRKGQNTLLIKGGPGTGKTILSLELLKRFSKGRTGAYLGTRISTERLLVQHPWLKGVVDPKHLLSGATPSKGKIAVSDTRFRGSPIQQLYEAAMGTENPFVVVDSWEVLAGGLEPSEMHKAFGVLESLLASKNANLVFVSETSGDTPLDYQADGIVVLSLGNLEGRILRTLELRKLRGVGLHQLNHLFSLAGGRFHHLPAFSYKWTGKEGRWKPIPDSETHFSTGSVALDRLLGGGYPRGGTVLLDIGPDVPMVSYSIFPMSLLANAVSQGRGFLGTPAESWGLHQLRAIMSRLLGVQALDRLTRFLVEKAPSHDVPWMVDVEGADTDSYIEVWRRTRDALREETGQPVVSNTFMRTRVDRYGEEVNMNVMGASVDVTKQKGDLELHMAIPGIEEATRKAAQLADVHIRIESRYGCSYLYGVKPFTPIHGIGVGFTKGVPKLDLTPIV